MMYIMTLQVLIKETIEYSMNLVYQSFGGGRVYSGYNKLCASLGHGSLAKRSYCRVKSLLGFLFLSSKDDDVYQCLVSHYET